MTQNFTQTKELLFLQNIKDQICNHACADCGVSEPKRISIYFGIFLCDVCSDIHKKLLNGVSEIREHGLEECSVGDLDRIRMNGNLKSNQMYEKFVPDYYRKPDGASPFALKEQWICSKYQRKEFISESNNLNSRLLILKVLLMKKGKRNDNFKERIFILDIEGKKFSYYIPSRESPKLETNVSNIKAYLLLDEKLEKTNSMQLIYSHNHNVRNIFVFSKTSKPIIDLYLAISRVQWEIVLQSYPAVDKHLLKQKINCSFLKEGWIFKSGPKLTDVRSLQRWLCLTNESLFYSVHPYDAAPKGVISLEGDVTVDKDNEFNFLIKTLERTYEMSTNSFKEKMSWVENIEAAINANKRILEKRT